MDIHTWFELSYANYLVLPRSLLQTMPDDWQEKFVDLLNELNEERERHGIEMPDEYMVQARDRGGRFVPDPLSRYDRGRRKLWQ